MSQFEWFLLGSIWAAIVAAIFLGVLFRPRRPVVIPESVFGLSKTEYDRELHRKDMEIFELHKELGRARDRMTTMTGQLEDMVDRWLTDSLALATTRNRLHTTTRKLRWNRNRVRRLTPPRNVIQFPLREAQTA